MNRDIAEAFEIKTLSLHQTLVKSADQPDQKLNKKEQEIKKNNAKMLRGLRFLFKNKNKMSEFDYLIKTAVLNYKMSQFGEAEQQYCKALTLCKSPADTNLKINILIRLAKMNLKLRIYITSKLFFEEALSCSSQVENFDQSKLIRWYGSLEKVYNHLGEISKATFCLETALEIAKRNKIENFNIAKHYFTLADHYKVYGLKSKAFSYFFESNRILIQIGKKDCLLAADCKIQIADYYLDIEALEQSFSYYQEALGIYLQQPQIQSVMEKIADIYNDMGIVCLDSDDLKQAESLQIKSLKIRKALFKDGHLSIAHSYNNLAAVLVKAGRNDEALTNQQESLAIINRLGINKANAVIAGKYMVHLARIYESFLDKNQALNLYHQAMEIFRQFSTGEEAYVCTCRERIKFLQPKLSLMDYLNPFRLCNRKEKKPSEEKGLLSLPSDLRYP